MIDFAKVPNQHIKKPKKQTMSIKAIIKNVKEQSKKFDIDPEWILLLQYSRELKKKEFKRAEKIHEAVKWIRKPIRLKK